MKLDAEEDDIEAGMSHSPQNCQTETLICFLGTDSASLQQLRLEMLKSMEKTTSKALEMAAGPLEHVYGILVM